MGVDSSAMNDAMHATAVLIDANVYASEMVVAVAVAATTEWGGGAFLLLLLWLPLFLMLVIINASANVADAEAEADEVVSDVFDDKEDIPLLPEGEVE